MDARAQTGSGLICVAHLRRNETRGISAASLRPGPQFLDRFYRAIDEDLASFRADATALDDRAVAAATHGPCAGQIAAGTSQLDDEGLHGGTAGFHLHAVVGIQSKGVGDNRRVAQPQRMQLHGEETCRASEKES